MAAGMPNDTDWCTLRHVTAWLPFALAYLQQAFPQSVVVWRTDTFPLCVPFVRASPDCVGAMNQAMRRAAPKQGVRDLDFDTTFRSFLYDWDGVHAGGVAGGQYLGARSFDTAHCPSRGTE